MIDSPKSTPSSRSQSRSSHGLSALSSLLTKDVKISLEDSDSNNKIKPTPRLDDSDCKIPDKQVSSFQESYQESYTYGSFGYNNSFYQSYGESYEMPQPKFEEVPKPNNLPKPLFSVKELISLIIQDATVQQMKENLSSFLDQKLILDGEVDLLTKLDSLILVPAEEDGSPMDDLPCCTNNTDILNFGVRDFVIMDKNTEAELAHIRIEGNVSPNQPYDGTLARNVQVIKDDGLPVSLIRQDSSQTLASTEDDFYTLNDEDHDSLNNADLIQAFRTDTDEIKFHELQKLQEELKRQELENEKIDQHTGLKSSGSKNSVNSNRLRSSSGNLMISYCRPGSERWRVAQKLTVLPENAPVEIVTPVKDIKPTTTLITLPTTSTKSRTNTIKDADTFSATIPIVTRKEEVAAEVRKQLQQSYGVIPQSNKQKLINNNNNELDRRHSDRPYNEEIDDESDSISYKYSRKYSYSSEGGRPSSMLDLNPHTALSFSAQLSPAQSQHGDHDSGSDDDQLGLIKFERKKHSLIIMDKQQLAGSLDIASPGRSFGKDESNLPSNYFFPSSSNKSKRQNAQKSKLNVREPETRDENDNELEEEVIKVNIDEEDMNFDVPLPQLPPTPAPTPTEAQSPSATQKKRLLPRFPTQLYDNEDLESRYSDNASTRSATSTKSSSMLSRLFDYFSSKKRPSLASESNDSIGSSSQTLRLSISQQPFIYEKSQQVKNELPIVQNLDTGDVFPLGALKYESNYLPEAVVSPTVLFGVSRNTSHENNQSHSDL
jgi:hypothetical protein